MVIMVVVVVVVVAVAVAVAVAVVQAPGKWVLGWRYDCEATAQVRAPAALCLSADSQR